MAIGRGDGTTELADDLMSTGGPLAMTAYFFCKVCQMCPRTQLRACLRNIFGAIGRESAMRAYVETIAMIFGLLGAYFVLLPLTI
jgi:hypothetical protein